MSTTSGKGRISRRAFLELSSGALASTALVSDANAAKTPFDRQGTVPATKSEAVRMTGKIALEEHFGLPDSANYAGKDLPTPEDRTNFFDLGSRRIADMDRGGLDICILSLGAPGVAGGLPFFPFWFLFRTSNMWVPHPPRLSEGG